VARARALLEDGDAIAARELLASVPLDDVETALLAMRILAVAPDATVVERAREAVGLEHLQVVVAACAALNARAAQRPLDAPPPEGGGPGLVAAELARERIVKATGAPEEGYLWINRANGLRAAGPAHDADARAAYESALATQRDNGHWWFDYGVLHKWRGRFRDGLRCVREARAQLGATKPILWNQAICATGAGEGEVALEAWSALGLPARLASGGLPSVDGLPAMRVRAPSVPSGHGLRELPDRSFESVWVAPLSPCHGVVQSPSFQQTPIDYGDVVLWDGAPVAIEDAIRSGSRPHGATPEPVPCFPLLEILRRGDEQRVRFVAIAKPEQVERLGDALRCRVFVHSEPGPGPERLVYGKLVAPADLDLRTPWSQATRDMRAAAPELYEGGDPKRAGQEHQAWRGVERVAVKRGLVSDA